MKESVLPISRSESSGSSDSIYSFSQESEISSPTPSSASFVKGLGDDGTSIVYHHHHHHHHQDSKSSTPPKLFPKQMKSTRLQLKEFFWNLYITFPFMIITIFGTLIIIEKYFNGMSNINDVLYRPNLPSSFESATGMYDNLNIEFYDLNDYKETPNGWQNEERILYCVPLRDASQHLPMFFGHLKNLTYPHNLVDLAFLISDTTDSTIKDLKKFLKEIQLDPNIDNRFGRINIYEKNFGQVVGQTFSDRHGFALQGPRRKLMAIARNWLLSTALRPDHSWVYWRDIDVETCPGTIIEDLMHHDKDVIVPNVWRPLPDWLDYEQPYDLNSWQESEGGIELLDRLDEDAVIVEGYSEYATWRPHLAYLRDPNGDPEVEMELDGIGGVSILVKASVFKSGAHFPAFSFQKHAETEAFGKLCKTMGYSVIGLPHYTIWHIYEPSSDDLKHMEWMAKEEQMRFEKQKLQKFYDRTWKLAFDDVSKEWDNLKFNVFKNTDLTKFRKVDVDWNEVDEYLQDINDQTINYEHFITEKEEEVRNYDANDPAKFIYNKYSHKKSEIDLKFKLNEFDKQKNLIKTDDFMNYGINKGEDLFGSFPINPYLSGNNPKSMRFVKFKKNEIIKFDEPEKIDTSKEDDENQEDDPNRVIDDDDQENHDDNNNEVNDSNDSQGSSSNERKSLNDEDNNKQEEKDSSSTSPGETTSEDSDKKDKERVEIKQEDQLEPSVEKQSQKSTEDIRQDAMAAVLLKQKLAKQEIENLNKKEKLGSINQIKQADIDPESIKIDNELKLKEKVLVKQQEINALTLNKKKEEADNSVNLNVNSNNKINEVEADITDLDKLEQRRQDIELENDEKMLSNYQNDRMDPNDYNGLVDQAPDMKSSKPSTKSKKPTTNKDAADDLLPKFEEESIEVQEKSQKSENIVKLKKETGSNSKKKTTGKKMKKSPSSMDDAAAIDDEVKLLDLKSSLSSKDGVDESDPLSVPIKKINLEEENSMKSNTENTLPKKALGLDLDLVADSDLKSVPSETDGDATIGGLMDDVNIGGSKEKLAEVDNVKDEIIIPKKKEEAREEKINVGDEVKPKVNNDKKDEVIIPKKKEEEEEISIPKKKKKRVAPILE